MADQGIPNFYYDPEHDTNDGRTHPSYAGAAVGGTLRPGRVAFGTGRAGPTSPSPIMLRDCIAAI